MEKRGASRSWRWISRCQHIVPLSLCVLGDLGGECSLCECLTISTTAWASPAPQGPAPAGAGVDRLFLLFRRYHIHPFHHSGADRTAPVKPVLCTEPCISTGFPL